MQHMNPKLKECANACEECRSVCMETLVHCQEKGDKHAEAAHIRLLLDCAEICAATEGFLFRGSDNHVVCAACAEICDACARSCDEVGADFKMKRCAEVCRKCAQSCRSIAGAA